MDLSALPFVCGRSGHLLRSFTPSGLATSMKALER